MEHIKDQILQMQTSLMSLEQQDCNERTSQGMIVKDNELVPRKETFSARTFTEASKTLQIAFPTINKDWLMLLSYILKDEGYSDDDLKKVVLKVIKEEIYNHQTPAIAKFCNQVKNVKLYSVYDVDALVHKGQDSYKNFGIIHKGKKGVMMAKRADIEKYGIEEIQPKPIHVLPSLMSNDHA